MRDKECFFCFTCTLMCVNLSVQPCVNLYVDMLKQNTGLANAEELGSCMLDRDIWTKITGQARAAIWPRPD